MIQAIGDTVIVKQVLEDKAGSIILPRGRGVYNQYHGFIHAIVISIGPRYPYKHLKVGDKILYTRHEGKKLKYEGEEYLILKDRWVEARIWEAV